MKSLYESILDAEFANEANDLIELSQTLTQHLSTGPNTGKFSIVCKKYDDSILVQFMTDNKPWANTIFVSSLITMADKFKELSKQYKKVYLTVSRYNETKLDRTPQLIYDSSIDGDFNSVMNIVCDLLINHVTILNANPNGKRGGVFMSDYSYIENGEKRDYSLFKKANIAIHTISGSSSADGGTPAILSNIEDDWAFSYGYGQVPITFKNCKFKKLVLGESHPNLNMGEIRFEGCSIDECVMLGYNNVMKSRLNVILGISAVDIKRGYNEYTGTDLTTIQGINKYLSEHPECVNNFKQMGIKRLELIFISSHRRGSRKSFLLTEKKGVLYFKKN